MPVCPHCHAEYRDGYAVCGDCGTELIPDAPASSPDSSENKKSRQQPSVAAERYSGDRFLANVNDAVELAYIKSALAQLDIPFRVLAGDISQHLYILHGRSFMGINIYVVDDSFEIASEVLASYKAELLPDEASSHHNEAVPAHGYRFDLLVLRAYLIIDLIIFLLTGVY